MRTKRSDRYLVSAFLTGTTVFAGGIPAATQAADLSFNGFASIGVGRVLDDEDIFPEIDATERDSFYDSDVNFKPDSIYALQAIADLSDGLSFTAQIVGKGSRNFEPDLEWAYVTYKHSDYWSFSAGKKRLPYFYYSDFLEVGYAYHWIRPPISVYAIPQTTYNGFQGTFSYPLGSLDFSITGFHGHDDFSAEVFDVEGVQEDTRIRIEDHSGIVLNLAYEWLQIRGIFTTAQIEFSSFIPALGARVTSIDSGAEFHGIGVFLTPGSWIIGSEFTELEFDNSVNSEDNWYATLGYRIGSIMPHITYTESNNDDTFSDGPDLENITLGLRWDFHPSAALKLEYSENDITPPAGGVESDAELIAIAVDVVF